MNINVDIKLYRSKNGSLLCLTASRPDIMFSVCLCARFQSYPKESHLIAIKCIINITIGMGLRYLKIGQFFMTSFSVADYADCRVDRKSTSGTCQFLRNYLVSWSSKKQKFCSPLNRRGGVCCDRGFLCTSPLDEIYSP